MVAQSLDQTLWVWAEFDVSGQDKWSLSAFIVFYHRSALVVVSIYWYLSDGIDWSKKYNEILILMMHLLFTDFICK